MEEDFISSYLSYTSETEVPAFFSRWCAMSALGALLGRRFYFEHGHFSVFPNMYCMLIGSPGTRKSTAIKTIKKLITNEPVSYHTIAADKTSKEKFLVDLSGEIDDTQFFGANGFRYKPKSIDTILDENIFGEDDAASRPDAEMFIMADEINDFIGTNNYEFLSLLGNLWDYSGVFSNRIKSGKSIRINNPTISMLGGNTPVGFSLAFPSEIFGQGFFSRLILVYGEPNGKRIPFPKRPPEDIFSRLGNTLSRIREHVTGSAKLSSGAEALLSRIYHRNASLGDARFSSYSTRRFNHLLKLCLVSCASRASTAIERTDVVYANTVLSYTEHFMPKALGEFGKARNADVVHKLLTYITENFPVSFKDCYKAIASDIDKPEELGNALRALMETDKILRTEVNGEARFMPIKKALIDLEDESIDYSLLTAEELEMKK